ncbi:MAG TPA: hypothetical protein PK586_03875, partial [Casimicrobium sp.]|nr:hypothetical protein [Casimicrobium sp.]
RGSIGVPFKKMNRSNSARLNTHNEARMLEMTHFAINVSHKQLFFVTHLCIEKTTVLAKRTMYARDQDCLRRT